MQKQERISILILNEQQLFMDGVQCILERISSKIKYFKATSVDDAMQIAHSNDLNLLLLDISFIESHGFQILRKFREVFTHLPVVILSANNSVETVLLSFEMGVKGFVNKSISGKAFIEIIKKVLAGGKYSPPHIKTNHLEYHKHTLQTTNYISDKFELVSQLTPRQKEVLNCISAGLTNKEIAGSLRITESTTKTHVTAILRLLQVGNRSKAAKLLSEIDTAARVYKHVANLSPFDTSDSKSNVPKAKQEKNSALSA